MKIWKETFKFISLQGERLTFRTETNSLNGRQMWWFEEKKTRMYYGTRDQVMDVIRDIKKSCEVV